MTNWCSFKQNEARKMNYQEVVEEDRRKKLPANWEARQKRVDWELEDSKARSVSTNFPLWVF